MRKIVLLFCGVWCFFSISTQAQVSGTYQIKGADSIKLWKLGGAINPNATELILMNNTRTVPGFLFNIGNGVTQFKRALIKVNDSVYIIGLDTLFLHSSGGGGGSPGGADGYVQINYGNHFVGVPSLFYDTTQKSLIVGTNSTINAYSTSLGDSNIVGAYSVAFGLKNSASNYSISGGYNNSNTNAYSSTFGNNLINTYPNALVIGQFNDTTAWPGAATSGTPSLLPAFSIGNGTTNGARHNAFTVLRNGRVILNMVNNGTLDSVLIVDASGNVIQKKFTGGGGGGGTLDSVGLIMPTGFTVANSPQTGTGGTINVTTSLTGVVHAGTGAFTASNIVDADVSNVGWSKIISTPTTVTGYGITNAARTDITYANPTWISSLAWSKITGTPTSLSGYGITDPVVLTSGTYANPSWITQLAWSKITSTPTTLAGYGITDNVVNSINGRSGIVVMKNADSITNLPVDTSVRRNNYVLTFDSTNRKWFLSPGGSGGGGGSTTLASLLDVNISSPANNNMLVYNSGTTKWTNQAVSTSIIGEGSNLYWTNARFLTTFKTETTDSLPEGVSNLYFTNARARSALGATAPINYSNSTGVVSLNFGSGLINNSGTLKVDSSLFTTVSMLNKKPNVGGTPGYATYLTTTGNLYTFPILNDSASGYITVQRTLNFDGSLVNTALNYNMGNASATLFQIVGNKTGSATTYSETPQVSGGLRHYISNANAASSASVSDDWQTLIRQDILHTDLQAANGTVYVHGLPSIASGSNRYTWGTLTNYTGFTYTAFNKMLQYDSLGRFYILNSPRTGAGSDSILVRVTGTGELKMIAQNVITGSGVTRVGPIDSLARVNDGLQIVNTTILAQTADSTHPGLISAVSQKFLDSVRLRLFKSTIKLGHPGPVGSIWSIYANATGDTLFGPNNVPGTGILIARQTDSSRLWSVDFTTVAGLTNTQTLTNKTITSPIINTPTISTPVLTSLASASDTTVDKPLSVDGSGNVHRFNRWPGSGAGGTQTLTATASAFADTLKISGGNTVVFQGATPTVAGPMLASDKKRLDSTMILTWYGHGIQPVVVPYTQDSIIFPGHTVTASNYLTSTYTGNRDSISFNVAMDTLSVFGKFATRISIAALRARTVTPTTGQMFFITDTYQQGTFYYDASDNTTPDNTGTTLVDAANHRFKRVFRGPVHTIWFGVIGDGSTDMTAKMQAAIDYCAAPTNGTRHLMIDEGISGNIMIDSLTLKPGIVFEGDNSRVRFAPNNPARKYIFGVPAGPVDQWGMSNFQVICNASNVGQGVFNFTGLGQVSSPFNGGVWHLYSSNIQIMNCAGVAINLNATDGAGDIANQFLQFDHIRVYNTSDTTAMGVKVVGQLGQTEFKACEWYGAGSLNLNTRAFDLTSLGTSNDQIQSFFRLDDNTVQAYHDVMRASNAQGINVIGGHYENDSLGFHLTNRSTANFFGATFKNVGVGTNAYIIGDDLSHSTFIGNYIYGNVNKWYTSPSGTPAGIDFFGNHFQQNGNVTTTFTGQLVPIVSSAITCNYFKDIVVATTNSTGTFINTINSNAAPGEYISIRAYDQAANNGVVMLSKNSGNINLNQFGVNGMIVLRDKQSALLKRSDLLNTWDVVAVSNQDLYAAAAPTAGLYLAGEVIHNSAPTHTGVYEWVITSTGVCPSCGIDSVMMSGSVASGVGTVQSVAVTNTGNPLFNVTVNGTPTVNPNITFTQVSAPANSLYGSIAGGAAGYFNPSLTSSLFANEGTTTTVYHGNATGNGSFGAVNMLTDMTGTMQAAQMPALTGDVTTTAGSLITTITNGVVTNAKIANTTIDLTTKVTGILPPVNGGTGVNNGTKTLTLAGNLATTGNFASTFNMTGTTSVTFPTSGTLLTTTGSGASLTGIPLSIAGTANQVLVNGGTAAATGVITLSGPQSLGPTNSPTFSGITLNGNNTTLTSSPVSSAGTVGFNGTIGSAINMTAAINDGGFTGSGQTRPTVALAGLFGPSISAANTNVTFTDAATWYIDGAPTPGTNVTLTNPLALLIRSGKARFGGGIQINDGTQCNGCVLKSDANGNASWGSGGSATSGTYTPTVTGTTNIASISLLSANYMQIGNIVHARVTVNVTTSATSTSSRITFSLPVSTSVTTQTAIGWGGENTNGNGAGGYQSGSVSINGSATQGIFDFNSGTLNTSSPVVFEFTYTL